MQNGRLREKFRWRPPAPQSEFVARPRSLAPMGRIGEPRPVRRVKQPTSARGAREQNRLASLPNEDAARLGTEKEERKCVTLP